MAVFEFCQNCISLGDRSYSWVKICGRCFQGRNEYIRQIQRDMAYRTHIARKMAGYPCDASSRCPLHPPTYQFYTHQAKKSLQEKELVKKALAMFRRYNHSSITALELLSGHYLSLVLYCDSCYNRAVDGIEQNLQVSLCNGCLTGRESYVSNVHGHQDSFFEPWEVPRASPGAEGWVRRFQIASDDLEYDRYRNITELQHIGGGNPATDVSLVFAGLALPTLIIALAGVIYGRRQWRLSQEARGNEQAILTLNRLCTDLTNGREIITRQDVENTSTSDLTNGREIITRQDVENTSTSSFHTAETHLE